MKCKVFLVCAALLPALLFCGCRAEAAENTAPPAATDDSAEYLARIAELEAELAKEREEKYISDRAYEKRIRALEEEAVPTGAEQDAVVLHYIKKDGAVTIMGYEGNSSLLEIPALLDGAPVTKIGERAFEGKKISSVVLPDSVKSIGWFAFYGCTELLDVQIPESVSSIDYGVFDGCPSLTIVCVPSSYAAKYAQSYGIPTRDI